MPFLSRAAGGTSAERPPGEPSRDAARRAVPGAGLRPGPRRRAACGIPAAGVADLLDPDTPPEAVEGSFVDEDAARTQCDALFRVRLRTGEDAFIFALLEHKSHIDAATPLQILKYLASIWLREIEGGAARDRLPAIVPLVFYHGPGRWTVPRSVAEMIDAPEELGRFAREFAYVLHDLGGIEPLQSVADAGGQGRAAGAPGGPCHGHSG